MSPLALSLQFGGSYESDHVSCEFTPVLSYDPPPSAQVSTDSIVSMTSQEAGGKQNVPRVPKYISLQGVKVVHVGIWQVEEEHLVQNHACLSALVIMQLVPVRLRTQSSCLEVYDSGKKCSPSDHISACESDGRHSPLPSRTIVSGAMYLSCVNAHPQIY